MTVECMLGVQIFADVVLCIAVILLIRVVSREMKKRPVEECARTITEFKGVIEDARHSADYLLRALQGATKTVPVSDAGGFDAHPGNERSTCPDPDRGREDIVKMAEWGMSAEEIADTTDLSEGEICLILDIHRKKNENSFPGDIVS